LSSPWAFFFIADFDKANYLSGDVISRSQKCAGKLIRSHGKSEARQQKKIQAVAENTQNTNVCYEGFYSNNVMLNNETLLQYPLNNTMYGMSSNIVSMTTWHY